MRRKRLLMASANYWRSPFQVGSHHLARGFARAGWEVAFVSDPISPLHLFGGHVKDVRERYDLYRRHGATDCDGDVWTYVPGALLTPHNRPLLRTRWIGERWAALSWPPLLETLRKRGFGEVDLVYCARGVAKGDQSPSVVLSRDRLSGRFQQDYSCRIGPREGACRVGGSGGVCRTEFRGIC